MYENEIYKNEIYGNEMYENGYSIPIICMLAGKGVRNHKAFVHTVVHTIVHTFSHTIRYTFCYTFFDVTDIMWISVTF